MRRNREGSKGRVDKETTDNIRETLYESYASAHRGVAANPHAQALFERDFRPFLPPDLECRILDIGCGQGDLVAQFLNAGYKHTTGVDVSPEQVEIAQRRGLFGVTLGDYKDALAQGRYDVVTATDFFEHLTKPEVVTALRRVYDSLVAGGVLLGRVPNAVSPLSGNYQYGDFTHETSFTAASLRQLANTVGFADVIVRPFNPLRHGVRSAARGVMWSVFAFVIKLALAAETGIVRGHIVTQNMTFSMRK